MLWCEEDPDVASAWEEEWKVLCGPVLPFLDPRRFLLCSWHVTLCTLALHMAAVPGGLLEPAVW